MSAKRRSISFFAGILLLTLTACAGGESQTSTSPKTASATETEAKASNSVLIDGSSTVFFISELMARAFMSANPGVRVVVGVSTSGAGFKSFCIGDTDISNASRPITASEMELCQKNGVEYVEIPLAYDGISIVANPNNDWAECLTVEELNKIWNPEAQGKLTNWKQIREDFPEEPLRLYGPDTQSGTYDYFTDAIVGSAGESRTDYGASENDAVIAQGIESDWGNLGFFGYVNYSKHQENLKLIKVDNGSGECVEPNATTIGNGTYSPLARPLFAYVNKNSIEKIPAVKAFTDRMLAPDNKEAIAEAGYVPLPESILSLIRERVEEVETGSIFEGESAVGVKLMDKLTEDEEEE